ncbi:MAG: RDD family protein [Kocuria sp.]|nr:RDD family protein [Kocuria sp.]
MINRDDIGSWLDGPSPTQDYPGQRLGRPDTGPGSVARIGPRVVAIFIDWLIAMALAAVLVPYDQQNVVALWIWFGLTAVAVGFSGHSLGHFLMGMQVQSMEGEAVGLWRGVLRSALILPVLPPVIVDSDQRGLHDRAVGTVLVKTR